jgi:hypothetical protein
MATTATERRKISLAPNRLDQLLAAGSAVLMAFVVMAIVEGRTDWLRVPPIVWAHIITILLALGLTPVSCSAVGATGYIGGSGGFGPPRWHSPHFSALASAASILVVSAPSTSFRRSL